MREILFRGKRVDNGEWVYGDLFSLFERPCIKFGGTDKEIVGVKAETVGQYTGLTDKNGVKIYEVDILKVIAGKHTKICRVIFQDGAFVGIDEDGGECDFRYLINLEVIGNIHDNAELLGETK